MKIRLLVLASALALATSAWIWQQDTSGFPHAAHAKLFIACGACHTGIVTGDSSRMFPSRAVCAECHNGTVVKTVTWTARVRPPSNLKFSHTAHDSASALKGNRASCISCHTPDGDTTFMHVGAADPQQCLSCHLSSEHLASTAVCATCHVPLTQARQLPESVVARFPKPPSHTAGDFIATHGAQSVTNLASCATCHARESCTRCHANAAQIPQIAALAPDARVATIVRGLAPSYPTPETHARADWVLAHGADAKRAPQGCADCHVQSSCTTCHTGSAGSTVIKTLPLGGAGSAPGVKLLAAPPVTPMTSASRGVVQTAVRRAPLQDTTAKRVSVHPADFLTQHKTVAASGALSCQGCHQTRECATCHSGTAPSRTYHPADFVSRHGTDAFRESVNCSSCHRVETFCRACHTTSGLASTKGSTQGSAHASQPLWLLQHGQAARQGLTTCTSCHQQTDCLRCHSTLGENVNPHGPGFNASAMSKRNSQVCLICHVTNPLKP